MKVAVVYESLFGNTHEIAGVSDAQPAAQVALIRVAEADAERVAQADLLVVGGPTHMRGMTTGFSRRLGVSAEGTKEPAERHELEPDAEGPGIRDWIHRLPKPAGGPPSAAAFDTRVDGRLAGGAAGGIARRLRSHGYAVVSEPEGFVVEGEGKGPLRAGELDRARAWGASLVPAAVVPTRDAVGGG